VLYKISGFARLETHGGLLEFVYENNLCVCGQIFSSACHIAVLTTLGNVTYPRLTRLLAGGPRN
jgi:hypothetical protein